MTLAAKRRSAPKTPSLDIPERRENWAEAEFKGKAKSVVTTRSGHVLLSDEPPGFAGGAGGENTGPTPTGLLAAAFAADIPVLAHRIAKEMGIEIASMRTRVTIAWNPRGIAGAQNVSPAPLEAATEVWLATGASRAAVSRLRAAYERRCPLFNLFRNSGCNMIENWHVEPAPRHRVRSNPTTKGKEAK